MRGAVLSNGRAHRLHQRASIEARSRVLRCRDTFTYSNSAGDPDSSGINDAGFNGACVTDRHGDCVGPSDVRRQLRRWRR